MKTIKASNLHSVDETALLWRSMTSGTKTDEEWLAFFNRPQLNTNIPAHLKELFEVARGAMIYSLYFYPLATLAAEQCYRLVETGVCLRCEQQGIEGSKLPRSFMAKLNLLVRRNAVGPISATRWEAIWKLRNFGSHPERQKIFDPGQAQRTVKLVGQCLNDLFP